MLKNDKLLYAISHKYSKFMGTIFFNTEENYLNNGIEYHVISYFNQ